MEEATGATRNDSTLNANNLSVAQATVSQVTGKIGFASSSTGATGVLRASSSTYASFWPIVQPGDSFTLAAWLYFVSIPGNSGGYRACISMWNLSIVSYFLWFPNNGQLTLTINNAANTASYNVALASQPSASTWYHIAFGYDDSINTAWYQWNGGTRQTGALVGVYKPTSGTVYFDVFDYPGGSGGVNMYVDEMGWWRRSLSSSEVVTLYNGGAGLSYPFS